MPESDQQNTSNPLITLETHRKKSNNFFRDKLAPFITLFLMTFYLSIFLIVIT
jgi:hypothetical protein